MAARFAASCVTGRDRGIGRPRRHTAAGMDAGAGVEFLTVHPLKPAPAGVDAGVRVGLVTVDGRALRAGESRAPVVRAPVRMTW